MADPRRWLSALRTANALGVLTCTSVAVACGSGDAAGPRSTARTNDARRIVFVGDSLDRSPSGIAVMDADGSHVTWLASDHTSNGAPAWSADGRRLLFNSQRAGAPGIWAVNADGTGLGPVVQSTGDSVTYHGTWSPDGRLLAYTALRWDAFAKSMTYMVYIANADGTAPRRLTSNAAGETRQAWAPDGRRLAFAAYPEYRDIDIFTINLDGGGQTRLTHGGLNDAPAWSPDGRRIAFQHSGVGGGSAAYNIHVMNADGSDVQQLTRAGQNTEPAWSPDGTELTFTSFRDGTRQLYRMRSDGTAQHRVTGLPGGAPGGSGSAWQP